MAISNYLFSPTSENPKGFSIRFLFAKLYSEARNKPYKNTVYVIKTGLKMTFCNK